MRIVASFSAAGLLIAALGCGSVAEKPELPTVTFNYAPAGGGGAIHNRASGINTYIVNSILWGNSDDIANTNGAYTYVHYSDIQQAGFTGNNNISIDPQFVNAGTGDFQLFGTSSCIDAGTDFFAVGTDTLVNIAADGYLEDAPDMGDDTEVEALETTTMQADVVENQERSASPWDKTGPALMWVLIGLGSLGVLGGGVYIILRKMKA